MRNRNFFLVPLAAIALMTSVVVKADAAVVPLLASSSNATVTVAPAPVGPSVRQLITVSTPSGGATGGTLSAWSKDINGYWSRVLGPVAAHVGGAGVGQAIEGSSKTPAGTFALTEAFGRQSNPGTAMPYFVSDTLDWWNGNVNSPAYNTHVRQASNPGGASENLYRAGAVYDYAVNIGYNLERTPGAGSAFFLHVTDGGPTAGCVAINRASLVTLLQWLSPGQNPHIDIRVGAEWVPDAAVSPQALKTDAAAAVKLMFASLLQRQVDQAGLNSWAGQIVAGKSFASSAQEIASSAERRSRLIGEIYGKGLGRPADAAGAAVWSSRLATGAAYADVAAGILGSSEGVSRLGAGSLDRWVSKVFQFGLGRTGTPAERSVWIQRAIAGGTVAAASGILRSTEAAIRLLDSIYLQMLGRHADTAARAAYASAMPTRGLFLVPGNIAQSGEFKGRARGIFPA